MKRIIAAVLAVSLILSVTACSGGDTSAPADSLATSGNSEERPLRSNPIALDENGNIDMEVALKYETDVDALIKKLEAKTPDGSKPVSENTNEETLELFNYLKSIYGKQILAGQQYSNANQYENIMYYNTTGDMPAIMGFDFLFAQGTDEPDFTQIEEAIKWHNEQNGIVAFCWHWKVPVDISNDNVKGTAFYSKEIRNFSLENAVTPGTKEYEVVIKDIDTIALYLQRLESAGVPVIWRPLHEASGNWFWWGREAGSADDYIALWQWTRNDMNLRIPKSSNFQILYAYSPDKLTRYEDTPEGAYRETAEWYPGDEYVDIIGTDCYHHGGAEGTEDYLYRAHRQLDAAARMAKEHGKRFAFTETGCEALRCPHWYTTVLLPLLREYPDIEYVLVWRNAWDIPTHYFLPLPGTPEAEDFKIFMNQLRIVHRTSVNRK